MTIGQRIEDGMRAGGNPSWWSLLITLPWVIGAIVFIYQWTVYREIATREQMTEGVITAHEPSNHDRYGYVFSVNDKNFSGWESPRTDHLEVGKRVVVYYDPQNPTKNALTEFRDLGMENLGPILMTVFGTGAVAWFIAHGRRRYRINSRQSQSCP